MKCIVVITRLNSYFVPKIIDICLGSVFLNIVQVLFVDMKANKLQICASNMNYTLQGLYSIVVVTHCQVVWRI